MLGPNARFRSDVFRANSKSLPKLDFHWCWQDTDVDECMCVPSLLRPVTPLTSRKKIFPGDRKNCASGPLVLKRRHASNAEKRTKHSAQVEKPTLRTSHTKIQVSCKELAEVAENVTIDSSSPLSPRLNLLRFPCRAHMRQAWRQLPLGTA